ncbi:hypothetical protein TSUD_291240 [Trifolium subterraneum]|uniref:Reverse transcriptase domain-containing protein n=1 Tax=Trifolium subterraneum TaxID=3900 RepID=A0A2Z6P7I8_TRISU|nr:hypothetical protein TSUD_291240 [Trifolium subterraneum]
MASTSWLNLFPNNSWLREPDLEEVVLDGWGLHENIEVAGGIRGEEGIRYQEIHDRHVVLMVQEDDYWKQRAKMHWLKEGDMNTSFFHKSATARHKKKNVRKLVNEDGIEVHTQEELCEVAKQYFDTLFKPKNGEQEPILNLIQRRVTEEDNIYLAAPITKDEIQQALFQMHPNKSPGPDGFNPAFYQRFWEQCGDDIFVAASNWLDRGYFPTSLNETNICLIPKCDNPISMKDLHPISLSFVEGRSILDNALIAIEVIHALKRKTKGRKSELALKIDISKACDKVDWGFLRGVLTSMGFGDRWIRWIMMCVSFLNYSVLMNYDKVGPIITGRGLRQGGPLSPYLFILVAEGLTSLIHQAVGRGDVHGARICRGAPEVSHLLFANDCFLFCRASVVEVNHLMSILHTYELASGQEINLAKSEVFFSRNLSHAAKEDLASILGVRHVLGTGIYLGLPSMIGRKDLASILGVRHVLGTGIYLGLPSMIGRSKKAIFSYIKDRIWKKINSWIGRTLSKAGKEGGGSNNNKRIHWLAWDRLACPKAKGGLGFRNFEAFNMGMVAKQTWIIIQNPESLAAKIIKARYFSRSSLLWRIGSGDRIRVMYDPWMRGNGDHWVSSPQVECVYDLFVKDLLLENYKAWDIAKIRHLFFGPVVEEIIATPLISSVKEDKLVWEEERNGCYSVKSGYNLAMRCIFRSDKHHVEEDDIHVFFGCVAARECWMAACLSQLLENPAYQDITVAERVFEMCRNEDNAMIGRVSSLFWCIWHNRKDKIWNDNIQLPSQVGRMAFAVWNEWFTVHQLQRQNIVPVEDPRPVRWKKPDVTWIKCNVDVAFVAGSSITCMGLCFRDTNEQFVAGLTQWQQPVYSIVEGET